MNYLQRKKQAFISIVNDVKGFVKSVQGVPPISLEDCVNSDSLIDWKLYGNSVQDGEPTPEAPIEVQSVGELTSKNLFDKSKTSLKSTQNETVGNYWGTQIMDTENVLQIFQPDTTYTISCDIEAVEVPSGENVTLFATHLGVSLSTKNSDYPMYVLYDKYQIKQGEIHHIEKTFTTKSDFNNSEAKYTICLYANRYLDDGVGILPKVIFRNIQIEKGSTATEYEPYNKYKVPVVARGENSSITTNLYLDEPLRSQYHSREKQWYYDKVDYKTGTIIRNLAEKTFVGTADENWTRRVGESDTKICFFITGIKNNTSFGPDNVMCDKFIANYSYASNVNTDLEGVSLACTTDIFYIGILKSRLTDAGLTVDLDGFKTWLSQNPVTITYILKEPTEETISIPKLPTVKGTTIYEIGTSLNASNMEATYYSTSKGG